MSPHPALAGRAAAVHHVQRLSERLARQVADRHPGSRRDFS